MIKLNNLFVGNLSKGTTFLQLANHFTKMGKVLNAKVILDREGLCKGYGYIEMNTEAEAKKAMVELEHSKIDGREIEIKEAKPQ